MFKVFDEKLEKELEQIHLEEQMLAEMARVCDFKSYTIFVNSKEGFIPHFHIWDSNSNGQNFHTCIRLDKAEYFHHTGKESILNASLRKDLCETLKEKPKDARFDSYWDILVFQWNISNPGKEIAITLTMPDYTQLK